MATTASEDGEVDPSGAIPPAFAQAQAERRTAAELELMEDGELFERVDEIVGRLKFARDTAPSGGPTVARFMTTGVAIRIRKRLERLIPSPVRGWGRQAVTARVIADMTGLPELPQGDADTQKAGNNLCAMLDSKKLRLAKITGGGTAKESRRRLIREECLAAPWLGTPDEPREADRIEVELTHSRLVSEREQMRRRNAALEAEVLMLRARPDPAREIEKRDAAEAARKAAADDAKAAKEAARRAERAQLLAAQRRDQAELKRLKAEAKAAKSKTESDRLQGQVLKLGSQVGQALRDGAQAKAATVAEAKVAQKELEAALKQRGAQIHELQTDREKAVKARVKTALKAALPGVKEKAKAWALEMKEGEIGRAWRLKNAALAAKRVAEARADKAEEESETRHEKLKAAKRTVEEMQGDVEGYKEEREELIKRAKAGEEARERLASMPTWRTSRPVSRKRGCGGGRAFDHDYRVSVFEQFTNGTPKSSISRNIVSIVKRAAPWLEPQEATAHQLGNMRFELRTDEEAMAARRVAKAARVRVLGFDETTKDQEPALTSNVQIQDTEGGPLINVILRGAYITPGGTAELLAKAIEEKCFGRGRDLLRRWEAMFRQLFPGEEWTGPDPEQLGLHRLGGGGGVMSDTCSTARKTKRLLKARIAALVQEMLGSEWDRLSEDEQEARVRVHLLDCMHHIRNIFLAEMSRAQAANVKAALQGHLDAFSSWERMTTDFDQFLRAVYKEFHTGGKYYKGKGREMLEWMTDTHPTACYLHLERAGGGRQDLDFDAAVPIYMNRAFLVAFLHRFVHQSSHSNQLEDFLYSVLRSVEFLAMGRTNGLVDLLISRPLRWLAGKAGELTNWSPAKSTWALDLAEQALERTSNDGSFLLDPQLDIFGPIAAEQPLFREYRKFTYKRDHILSPDRSVAHLHWKVTRAEMLSPIDATNQATRAKTIEYLEVQAAAGLRKFHDPKLVLAEKLTSQEGAGCLANTSQMHNDTLGCTDVNDGLAESVFGVFDRARLVNPGILQAAASALTHARLMKSFSHGDAVQHRKGKRGRDQPVEDGEGYIYTLPKKEAIALVEMGRVTRIEMRKIDAADAAEHTAYIKAKRKADIEEELEAVIKQFALAVTFFDRWKAKAVRSIAEMNAKLRGDFNEPDARKRDQLKLNWLREQIQMRVLGFNWTEFKTPWASGSDEHVGTVDQLNGHLKEIIETERERAEAGELPESACAPIMQRKVFKPLGTLTAQAAQLTSPFVELTEEQLLARVRSERERLHAAGEIDDIEDAQPDFDDAPVLDSSLVGWKIDVRWRYWITDPDTGKRKSYYIWCEGEVEQVANGTTDKRTPACRNLLDKGAVRIKWPEDVEFEEKESAIWSVLKPEDFNKQRHLGWRYSAASIQRLAQGERPQRTETPGSSGCAGQDQREPQDEPQDEPQTVRKPKKRVQR